MCDTEIHLTSQHSANQNSTGILGRNSKTYMEMQRTRIANILLKMNKIEGLTQPDFKAYYKNHINQECMCVGVGWGGGAAGREEKVETQTHGYGQLISIKGVKLIRWKKRCRNNSIATCKKDLTLIHTCHHI